MDINLIIALLVGFILGGGVIWWVKSRPVTTKAEALRLLAVEANLIAKMPGASEAKSAAEQQAQAEAMAAQHLAATMARLAGNAPQS